MWHTSRGDRTLRGAEAELVGHAVDTLVDALVTHIDDGSDECEATSANECLTGIALFDDLTPSQRIALLHDVTKHLLMPTDSSLELNAHAEAAVAAIFGEVRDQVAIEIDLFPFGPDELDEDPELNVTWRQLVLNAYEAVFRGPHPAVDDLDFDQLPAEIEIPEARSRNMEHWGFLVESLTDAVLWDRDYEMADSFLDADPGLARQRRQLLGIDDDYFTKIAPDPDASEAYRLAARTQSIVRAKPR